MRLHYRPDLKQLARDLRNHSTLAEIRLWRLLKGRQRRGYDFHRQRPVDRYILDFFAPKLMLAVEIDGETHRFKADSDAERQVRLESLGIQFLRLGEHAVREDPAAAAALIDRWIAEWEKSNGTATTRPNYTPRLRSAEPPLSRRERKR